MKQLMTVIALAGLAAAAGAQQHDDSGGVEVASVDWLKSAYLRCDTVMSTRRVDAGTAQQCSRIGEHLKQRGFGGNFERLIEWWQGERRTAAARDANEQRVSF